MPEHIVRKIVRFVVDGRKGNASRSRRPGSDIGSDFLYSAVTVRTDYGLVD